ncbi:hypothetical protein ACO0RG_004068 [Hanseniaspora osmophila]|uniref:Serine/threonine-protein kinase RIO1 n=1 Tax=Hanseniaspora osmophila TaxID=56408 RepID=A0A1E5RBR5_9ASCO|nr:Serine/threonine-protein kinase RIO1 [Hanseniaspora osmophila]
MPQMDDYDDGFSKMKISKAKNSHMQDHTEHDKSKIMTKFADKIKTDEMSYNRAKVSKDKADRATVENVLDPRTMRFLKSLVHRGVLYNGINGCLSTGKEANVYHAFEGDRTSDERRNHNRFDDSSKDNNNNSVPSLVHTKEEAIETPLSKRREFAVKIYKTSILVFKDREKYVEGEFRFRHSRSQHNPRKMIKVWAEKEFRNLKRIYQSNIIPCPEPIEVKSNVLVMEFLTDSKDIANGDGIEAPENMGTGNSRPSPKLRDHNFQDDEDIKHYYYTMLAYIRILYQKCALVHADLSEYNSIVHNGVLYIIDVSQSVQPEHPMSLDFLRMDIKNVNGFFERMGIPICCERLIFQFVIQEVLPNCENDLDVEILRNYARENIRIKETQEDDEEDQVFRSLYLVRNLNGLEERDFERFTDGKFDLLKSLLASDNAKVQKLQKNNHGLNDDNDDENSDSDEGSSSEDSDEEGSEEEENSDEQDSDWEDRSVDLKGKKFEDKDAKKDRKEATKLAKREKRATKMKKHVKKKLVNKTKTKK